MEVTVLMIDDHPPIIEGYKSILTYNPYGYLLNTKEVYNCESAYKIITSPPVLFDLVMIDITLPPYPEKNIQSGVDLVPLIKRHLPNARIMILTSHCESIILFKILKECQPNGLLVKSDFLAEEFLVAFDSILKGNDYHSSSIRTLKNEFNETNKIWDNYNRQILLLLSVGVQTKSLSKHLNLSKSAIDKRKAIIKDFFGIEKGTDEDILREARKQGLI